MLVTSDEVSSFVYESYIIPARERGDGIMTVPVLAVWKAFDGSYKQDFIRGVLGSMKFRNTYHLALVAAEGPSEGPVDTYVFKLRAAELGASST